MQWWIISVSFFFTKTLCSYDITYHKSEGSVIVFIGSRSVKIILLIIFFHPSFNVWPRNGKGEHFLYPEARVVNHRECRHLAAIHIRTRKQKIVPYHRHCIINFMSKITSVSQAKVHLHKRTILSTYKTSVATWLL